MSLETDSAHQSDTESSTPRGAENSQSLTYNSQTGVLEQVLHFVQHRHTEERNTLRDYEEIIRTRCRSYFCIGCLCTFLIGVFFGFALYAIHRA